MKRNLILATSPLLLIFSCASIETQDENNTTSSVIKINENEKFLNYLNDDCLPPTLVIKDKIIKLALIALRILKKAKNQMKDH